MNEEEKTGFWNYPDKDIIDELGRYSGIAIAFSDKTRQNGIICEALRRILIKLGK